MFWIHSGQSTTFNSWFVSSLRSADAATYGAHATGADANGSHAGARTSHGSGNASTDNGSCTWNRVTCATSRRRRGIAWNILKHFIYFQKNSCRREMKISDCVCVLHLPGRWFIIYPPCSEATQVGGDYRAYPHLAGKSQFKASMTPRAVTWTGHRGLMIFSKPQVSACQSMPWYIPSNLSQRFL